MNSNKHYNIKVIHKDGSFSWLMAGYKLEFTASKCEYIIKLMSKQEQFSGARFEMVEG